MVFLNPDDRNDLERLTLAVLTHLPTAVLYVHDLTGECGTSPDDQVCHIFLQMFSSSGTKGRNLVEYTIL